MEKQPTSKIKNDQITVTCVLIAVFVCGILSWLQYEKHTSRAYKLAEQALQEEVQKSGGGDVVFYFWGASRIHMVNGLFTRCDRFGFLVKYTDGFAFRYVYLRKLSKFENLSVYSIASDRDLILSCMNRI